MNMDVFLLLHEYMIHYSTPLMRISHSLHYLLLATVHTVPNLHQLKAASRNGCRSISLPSKSCNSAIPLGSNTFKSLQTMKQNAIHMFMIFNNLHSDDTHKKHHVYYNLSSLTLQTV